MSDDMHFTCRRPLDATHAHYSTVASLAYFFVLRLVIDAIRIRLIHGPCILHGAPVYRTSQ